jgi:hypothetical protein
MSAVGVRAGGLVSGLTRQEMVRGDEDGVRHGHYRLRVPPVPDPAMACGEGSGGRGADTGGEGGLDQDT